MTREMAARMICITNRKMMMMKLMHSLLENIMKSKIMKKN